jgi:hypothetical protein
MTDIRVSQVGAEAWVEGNPAMGATQVGAEVWYVVTQAMIATQVGAEVWYASPTAASRPNVCIVT